MATTDHARTPARAATPAPLLWTTLALYAATAAFALLDPSTTRLIAAQVDAGYPSYTADQTSAAVSAYVALLAITGALGIAGWFVTIRLARRGRRGAPWLATALWAVGLLTAVAGLTVRDTSGAVGLAPAFGWLLLAACIPGLVAVVSMARPARPLLR